MSAYFVPGTNLPTLKEFHAYTTPHPTQTYVMNFPEHSVAKVSDIRGGVVIERVVGLCEI